MKIYNILLSLLFVSLFSTAGAQIYSVTDSCNSVIVARGAQRDVYPKGELKLSYTAYASLSLIRVSQSTVVAIWSTSDVHNIDSLYHVIAGYLSYGCINIQCANATQGATGPTGPAGTIATPNTQIVYGTGSGVQSDNLFTRDAANGGAFTAIASKGPFQFCIGALSPYHKEGVAISFKDTSQGKNYINRIGCGSPVSSPFSNLSVIVFIDSNSNMQATHLLGVDSFKHVVQMFGVSDTSGNNYASLKLTPENGLEWSNQSGYWKMPPNLGPPNSVLTDVNGDGILSWATGSGSCCTSYDSLNVKTIISASRPPSATLYSGAGTGATVTINGTDIAGQIFLTTGSSPATMDTVLKVDLSETNGTYAIVTFSANGPASAGLSGNSSVWFNNGVDSYSIFSNATPLAASTIYLWNYHVIRIRP